jgi:hypothetical protein
MKHENVDEQMAHRPTGFRSVQPFSNSNGRHAVFHVVLDNKYFQDKPRRMRLSEPSSSSGSKAPEPTSFAGAQKARLHSLSVMDRKLTAHC